MAITITIPIPIPVTIAIAIAISITTTITITLRSVCGGRRATPARTQLWPYGSIHPIGAIYFRGHTNPPHPHTSDLINLNDLSCSEESSVLRAFSELLHLINSNLNLLNGWWWGWGGFVWPQIMAI